jgi:hypothetical protein
MIQGFNLFASDDEVLSDIRLQERVGSVPQQLTVLADHGVQFVQILLAIEPAARPDVEDALRAVWIASRLEVAFTP